MRPLPSPSMDRFPANGFVALETTFAIDNPDPAEVARAAKTDRYGPP